ncbi:hypothetical protein OA07_08690 [Aphanizomenon flos-aquae 2012/KM1/D3]|nr:hypothetical protein OA07_08690 [Aphanizomenon flos-aquae 2012/KM1/D3]
MWNKVVVRFCRFCKGLALLNPYSKGNRSKVEKIKKLIFSFVITVNGEFWKLIDQFTPHNAELKNKKENAFSRKTVSKL